MQYGVKANPESIKKPCRARIEKGTEAFFSENSNAITFNVNCLFEGGHH